MSRLKVCSSRLRHRHLPSAGQRLVHVSLAAPLCGRCARHAVSRRGGRHRSAAGRHLPVRRAVRCPTATTASRTHGPLCQVVMMMPVTMMILRLMDHCGRDHPDLREDNFRRSSLPEASLVPGGWSNISVTSWAPSMTLPRTAMIRTIWGLELWW